MIKLFSGSANYELVEKIANETGIKISKSEVTRFDNSEVKVTIGEDVKNKNCVIIQSTANPTDTHLIELLFFADALKRKQAKKISAVIPYFGYARQNREHRPGESVSVNVVIRMLEAIGFNTLYTVNLHDEGTEGVFSVPFKNISAFGILGNSVSDYLKNQKNMDEVAIVSPDQGGVERAQLFAENFFHNKNVDIAVIEKRRNLNRIHESKALNLYGQVENKTCIIVDDIITSGGTLVHAAELCMKKKAKRVIACVVHHDFSPNAKKILESSPIEKIFTTDTIKLFKNQIFPKLKEVSVAPLISREIKNL